MCRPSCCNNKSREGAGVAAVAVLAAGAVVAVKIGPIVARIIHLAVEVLTIITLTAASALAAILLTWVTVRIVRRRTGSNASPAYPMTTIHVAASGPGKSPLLVAKAREAIDGGGVVYVIDPKEYRSIPKPGHPTRAGAGYDCTCGECLIPVRADDKAAG